MGIRIEPIRFQGLAPLLLAVAILVGCAGPQQRDLFEAAAEGDVEGMRWLLQQGARPDRRDPQGVTPLMVAAYIGDIEGVRLLAEAGADVNARAQDGRTVLTFAAGPPGSAPLIRFLIGAGSRVNPSPPAGTTPLIEASRHGDAESVQLLLEAGAHPHARSDSGETALHVAGAQGTPRDTATVAEMLWLAGADPNATCLSGETALASLRARGPSPGLTDLVRRMERQQKEAERPSAHGG
jgi:ankyrin repeat protein